MQRSRIRPLHISPVVLGVGRRKKQTALIKIYLRVFVIEKYTYKETRVEMEVVPINEGMWSFIVFKDGGAEIVEGRRKSIGRIWLAP